MKSESEIRARLAQLDEQNRRSGKTSEAVTSYVAASALRWVLDEPDPFDELDDDSDVVEFASSLRTFMVDGVVFATGCQEQHLVVQIKNGTAIVLNADDNPHTMKDWALDYTNGLNEALGPPPEGAKVVVFDTEEGRQW